MLLKSKVVEVFSKLVKTQIQTFKYVTTINSPIKTLLILWIFSYFLLVTQTKHDDAKLMTFMNFNFIFFIIPFELTP